MKRVILLAGLALVLAAPALAVDADSPAGKCMTCHKEKSPGLYRQWFTSKHGSAGVTCIECHGAAKGELWNKRIDVIKIFMGSYSDMSPEMSRILLDQSFAIEKQMLELEMKYAEKFDDVLPPNKVTRLFQAENKLETAMNMEIAKDVPLAK